MAKTRGIKVMFARSPEFTPLKDVVLHKLKHWGDAIDLGPLSLETGLAIFGKDIEEQVTITLHEGTTVRAIALFLIMRSCRGLDCGRIIDRGLSYCAKVYCNRNLPQTAWGDLTYEPIPVAESKGE